MRSIVFLFGAFCFAILPAQISVIPKPAECVAHGGHFEVNSGTAIYWGEGLKGEAFLLREYLHSTGLPLSLRRGNRAAENAITLSLSEDAELGEEGYRLFVQDNGVRIVGQTPAGIFYGIQTLRQLLPVEIFQSSPDAAKKWQVPCVDVTDKPRFSWRGMHLDVSRHFLSKEYIKKYLDLLAMHKMNVFHWHLTDDGGWRIEIKKYPLLTNKGAWRTAPQRDWSYSAISFPDKRSGKEYGGYYSQSDIREVVRYASAQHITIVPEIEMPGHSLPALSCYPYLGCENAKKPGEHLVSSEYCAGNEGTYEFLQNVLSEVVEMFPSKYIHIGGDEVNKTNWNQCPICLRRMQTEHIANADELQSYLIRRTEKFLNSKGKTLIGWDEILEGGLAPNATVMSWRGIEGGIAAAKSGHDTVMTPTSHCYFDYSYDTTPTELVYSYEPVPGTLTEGEAKHVLGAQGNVWTEWIPDPARADQMAFPRAIALAETLWTPKEVKNEADFLSRLNTDYRRLDYLSVNYMMPKPRAQEAAIFFDGMGQISFQHIETSFTLRYTLDGSEPKLTSYRYTGPVLVQGDGMMTAAYFRKDGSRGEPTIVRYAEYKSTPDVGLVEGLKAERFEGTWPKLPDFSTLQATQSQIVTMIDTAVKSRSENFALRFAGFIRVSQSGSYTFTLGSDDGSALKIGGLTVIDNDGLHAYLEKTGAVLMRAGIYPIEVSFFQAGGAERLTLQVEGPGLAKSPIPASMLLHSSSSYGAGEHDFLDLVFKEPINNQYRQGHNDEPGK